MASGYPPAKLPGVEAMLVQAGMQPPPRVNAAVLACQQIEPGKVHIKSDGIEVPSTRWQQFIRSTGVRPRTRA